jgi:hypothetical protein
MPSIDEWLLVVKTIGTCDYQSLMLLGDLKFHSVLWFFVCFGLCREAREKQEEEETRAKNPSIRDQFADAKRQLATLSESDWENIPEPVRMHHY